MEEPLEKEQERQRNKEAESSTAGVKRTLCEVVEEELDDDEYLDSKQDRKGNRRAEHPRRGAREPLQIKYPRDISIEYATKKCNSYMNNVVKSSGYTPGKAYR